MTWLLVNAIRAAAPRAVLAAPRRDDSMSSVSVQAVRAMLSSRSSLAVRKAPGLCVPVFLPVPRCVRWRAAGEERRRSWGCSLCTGEPMLISGGRWTR